MRYSASLPALPLGLRGTHFVAVAGAQTSMLEALLVKRGLRGPGWTTLQTPTRKEGSAMVSNTTVSQLQCLCFEGHATSERKTAQEVGSEPNQSRPFMHNAKAQDGAGTWRFLFPAHLACANTQLCVINCCALVEKTRLGVGSFGAGLVLIARNLQLSNLKRCQQNFVQHR